MMAVMMGQEKAESSAFKNASQIISAPWALNGRKVTLGNERPDLGRVRRLRPSIEFTGTNMVTWSSPPVCL